VGGDHDEAGVRGRLNPKVGRGDEVVVGGDSSVTFFFKDNTLRVLESSDINAPLTEALE
jgi:hypothetical protein